MRPEQTLEKIKISGGNLETELAMLEASKFLHMRLNKRFF